MTKAEKILEETKNLDKHILANDLYDDTKNMVLDCINKALHIHNSFSSTKDYDKLFKEIYNEDKREGSVYRVEAIYTKGKWVSVKPI